MLINLKIIVISVIFLSSQEALADVVTLSDTEFNNADWSMDIIASDGGRTEATQAFSATPGIGNYRIVTNFGEFQPTTGPIFLAVDHINSSLTYDPNSQGAIGTLDLSIVFLNSNPAQALIFRLHQAGISASSELFLTGDNLSPPGWQNASLTGLTALDFPTIDFSETGAPINFGFYTANSNNIATITGSYDNFQVTITNPVPVPAAVWLFGSGLLGMIGVARRKKNN